MPAALPAHLKEQAVNLMLKEGLTSWQTAARLGLNLSTVRNWEKASNAKEITQLTKMAVESAVNRQLSITGDAVREQLANVIAAQAKVLQECPPLCVGDLQTNPDRQGLAAVTKTVVDSASAIFGWSDAGKAALNQSLRSFDSEVIDLEEVKPGDEVKQIVDQSVNKEG